MTTKITEKSYVSIGLMIACLSGFALIINTASQAENNTAEIKTLRKEDKEILKELKTHGEALARIETALGTK